MIRTASIASFLILAIGLSLPADEPAAKGYLPAGFSKVLTADQKTKAYKISSDHRTKIKALEAQILDLRQAERKAITSILTEQQRKGVAKSLGLVAD